MQAIDLATVAWAACLSDGGLPTYETCAWYHPDEDRAIREIVRPWLDEGDPVPEVMIIEDIPHAMRFDTGTKATCRMQGRIVDRMKRFQSGDRILFVPPALWQHAMGVWKLSPMETAAIAAQYGYMPPNMVEIHKDAYEQCHGKERQDIRLRLKKLMTDYVDAFLIAQWASETFHKYGTLDVKSSQRYLR